jgi:hypothetical protein
MAFKPLRRTENRAHAQEFAENDAAILIGISRDTSGEGAIFGPLDSVTTEIEFANGTAVTDIFIGGNTTFNGDVYSSQQLKISDDIVLLRSGLGTGGAGALINERGTTGDDFLVLWSETNTRFEIGLADTTAGASVPTALSTFSDIKINNLLLDSTAITADAALTVSATGSTDLTFGARSSTITLNDAVNTTVSGFTNTSIIGILNELKTGTGTEPASLGSDYTNGEVSAITEGQIVYISANDTVKLTDASSLTVAANFIGAVGESSIAASSSGSIEYEGVINVKFELSLALSAGDEVFLSGSTPGSATNVKPSGSGNVVQSIGQIKDVGTYDGSSNLLAEVHLVRGSQTTLP